MRYDTVEVENILYGAILLCIDRSGQRLNKPMKSFTTTERRLKTDCLQSQFEYGNNE
jgi:hypothetical protein